jgi:hypothetical protein
MSQAAILPSGAVPPSANWKQLYQCAILEFDHTKLPQRIAKARHAMMDRSQELKTESKAGEFLDLEYALHMLGLLEEVATRERSAA